MPSDRPRAVSAAQHPQTRKVADSRLSEEITYLSDPRAAAAIAAVDSAQAAFLTDPRTATPGAAGSCCDIIKPKAEMEYLTDPRAVPRDIQEPRVVCTEKHRDTKEVFDYAHRNNIHTGISVMRPVTPIKVGGPMSRLADRRDAVIEPFYGERRSPTTIPTPVRTDPVGTESKHLCGAHGHVEAARNNPAISSSYEHRTSAHVFKQQMNNDKHQYARGHLPSTPKGFDRRSLGGPEPTPPQHLNSHNRQDSSHRVIAMDPTALRQQKSIPGDLLRRSGGGLVDEVKSPTAQYPREGGARYGGGGNSRAGRGRGFGDSFRGGRSEARQQQQAMGRGWGASLYREEKVFGYQHDKVDYLKLPSARKKALPAKIPNRQPTAVSITKSANAVSCESAAGNALQGSPLKLMHAAMMSEQREGTEQQPQDNSVGVEAVAGEDSRSLHEGIAFGAVGALEQNVVTLEIGDLESGGYEADPMLAGSGEAATDPYGAGDQVTFDTSSSFVIKDFSEEGEQGTALPLIEIADPDDSELWNDAGAILEIDDG